jgi:hypothetical protein
MSNSYEIVKKKVDSGEVKIISIISPPRVASTALEIALRESPTIDGQINEPFHWGLNDRPDLSVSAEERGYAEILRRIVEILHETGKKNITVVMKEMAKNIAPGEQFARWCSINDKNLVLVRNPLLNVESLIRKLCEAVELKESLVDFDVNEFARNSGYIDKTGKGKHFQHMVSTLKEEGNYTQMDGLFRSFFPKSNRYSDDTAMQIAYLEEATDVIATKAGYTSLDGYALSAGYSDWKAMRAEAQIPKDFFAIV